MDANHSCCCCLLRPPDNDLKIPYTRFGKTEIYADMLKECFEINLKLPADNECGICEVCVGRLRDASDFKLQVQRSQDKLLARLRGDLSIKEEEPLVKSEMAEDCVPGEIEQQEMKPEGLEDPLPTDGSDVFMEFVLNFENHVSSVWKQEPMFEFAPIIESISRPTRTVKSKGLADTEDQPRLMKEQTGTKKDHGNLGNTCDICGKYFPLKTELYHHKKLHMEERYNCTLCNQLFKFKCHLDLHNRCHHAGEKLYPCAICNKKFATIRAMYKHKQIHFEKRYRCGECDKLFSNRQSLKKHKRTHSGEIPYNCDMCDAKFKIKRALIAHMGKHTGTMNFPCEFCSLRFWDYTSLLDHKRIHTGDCQTYSCDVCHKDFPNKNKFTNHMKTHSDRKYPCEFCDAELATLGSLKQHKLTHTGERAYPCEYCNKQFRFKHNLVAHIHIHTGEKPHCCEVCGKQFGRKDNLKTHLAIHAEGVRYTCELCPKSYPTKEGLRQHRRTHTRNNDQSKSPPLNLKTEITPEIKTLEKIEYIGNIVPEVDQLR